MSALHAVADEVRQLARLHLRLYADLCQAPTDVLAITNGLNITVISEPFYEDPSFTGVCGTDGAGFQVIVVNALLSPARWLFTVSHETGHLCLDHILERRAAYEHMANIYASELLMPLDRVLRQVRKCGTDARYLAGLNGVSVTAMRLRLQELPMQLLAE